MKALSLLGLLIVPALHLSATDTLVRPALVYSKPFGGTGFDNGIAVATDTAGNVYIAGNTSSPDFPVKNGLQPRMAWVPLRATTDNGNTWSPVAIPDTVYAVAGSAKASGVLYAGTSGAIYKSVDAGQTWVALSAAPAALVYALIVDLTNPAVVYAGTDSGIFESRDAGATWLEIGQQGWSVIDLVANPVRPSTLFAGITVYPVFDPESGHLNPSGPSLYRSTDAGATWTPLSGLPDPVIALACDPSNPDVLYATANPRGFGPLTDTAKTSIYKTVDAGNTWQKLLDSPVANSTLALAASPTSVYAATVNGVIRSRDGGATWAATPVTTGADNLAVDPSNPQIVYASAGGILVSSDGGADWKSALPVRQDVQTIAALAGNPTLVFVGASPGQNIFVTKWSGDGKQMIYSTYLGGSYYDFATGIAVDSQGNAYVTGYTYATDFPVTRGALQPKTSAAYAAFLAKIAPDGGRLIYSTYLSGSSGDAAFAVAVDGSGTAYLTGYAGSADFPVTSGAFQSGLKDKCAAQPNGSRRGDAFVTKLNTDGTALLYSTFLGGNCADEGTGITVDQSGRAYVVGVTESGDFPVTKGAFQERLPDFESGFVAVLAPQGSALQQASFIGGRHLTTTDAVAVDGKGALYITGCTEGFDDTFVGLRGLIGVHLGGPALPPAGFSVLCAGPAYLLKLDSTVSSKVYLNYLGGPVGEGQGVAVDKAGRAWISGFEHPIDDFGPPFSVIHPFQARIGQGFVSEWSADGATLLFSSRMDSANGMALDSSGNAFITGFTNPASKAFLPSAFIARVDGSVPSAVTVEDPQRITPGAPFSSMQDQGVAPGEILVLSGSGLGPLQRADAQIGTDGRVATTLAGVSVTFDGMPAPLLSAQLEQIVCIVPFGVRHSADGTTTMQVQNSSERSNSIRMPVAPTAVETFAVANQDGTANAPDRPAPPGSVATIYAAGFGETAPPSVDGEINGSATRSLKAGSVLVALYGESDVSGPVDILFAGPAPGQVAGIIQINFQVPQLAPGQYTVAVGVGPDLGINSSSSNSDYDVINLNVGQP